MLKQSIPVLHAADAARAEAFYVERLGFTRRFAYRADEALADPCYQGFERDGVWLHVSSFPGDGAKGPGDGVAGGVAYLVVEDVDVLHEELLGRGAPIALPPTDQTWGNRELYVDDPDGNSLRFVVEG